MPVRIQRSRARGWRMPAGTVSVTRPGKWGNPYPVDPIGIELSMRLFASTAEGVWDPSNIGPEVADDVRTRLYDAHCAWRKRLGYHPIEAARHELRGKNLACWCALSSRCHAEILLEIANS